MKNSKEQKIEIELVGTSYDAKFGKKCPRKDILSSLHKPYPQLHIHQYEYNNIPAYAACLDDGTDIDVLPSNLADEITKNYFLEKYVISVRLTDLEADVDEELGKDYSEYYPIVELTFVEKNIEIFMSNDNLVKKLQGYGPKKTKVMIVCFDIILAILALLTILMYVIDVIVGIIFTLLVFILFRNLMTYKKIFKDMVQPNKKTL